MRCLYEVLSVNMDADDGIIKAAYRRAALQWHPGLWGGTAAAGVGGRAPKGGGQVAARLTPPPSRRLVSIDDGNR